MSSYAALVAAQIGLDQEALMEQAMLSSQAELRDYYDEVCLLDGALQAQSLGRAVVPGDGDCLYHSLIKAAASQGDALGTVTDVRVLQIVKNKFLFHECFNLFFCPF